MRGAAVARLLISCCNSERPNMYPQKKRRKKSWRTWPAIHCSCLIYAFLSHPPLGPSAGRDGPQTSVERAEIFLLHLSHRSDCTRIFITGDTSLKRRRVRDLKLLITHKETPISLRYILCVSASRCHYRFDCVIRERETSACAASACRYKKSNGIE